jgi:CysZ protein
MHSFISDLKDGLRAYINAVHVIREQKLWIYLLIPGFISLGFGLVVVFFAQLFSSEVSGFIDARYPWEFGAAYVTRIGGFFGKAIVWAGAFMTYKYIVLILVAPFMSPLS